MWRTVGRSGIPTGREGLLAFVLTLAVAIGGYLVATQLRVHRDAAVSSASAQPSAAVAASVPPPSAGSSAAAAPVPAAVRTALAGVLADHRLGGRVLAEVSDAATGVVLLDRGGSTTAPPASTAKIATAAALLEVRKPTDRIITRVVVGADAGTVVLVGGGDPTLTAAAPGQDGAYAGAARISDLAAQLRQSGVAVTRVLVDASLFGGPDVAPGWAPGDAPSTFAAPIAAVMVDGARDEPGAEQRSADPAGAAGRALASALGLPGTSVSTGRAPVGARVLASVASAPMSQLVEQMLQQSDNVIAECLARQVAIAEGLPATFAGAVTAIRTVLHEAGVTIGSTMFDGSGLAASDRLAPASLVDLLDLAAYGPRAELRDVIAGLPVAGWEGTLADRYPGSAGAGFVQAKTGTLTGVSTLAGVVQDRDGRLLAFSLVADQVGPAQGDTDAAETALDAVAATLAGCGCR